MRGSGVPLRPLALNHPPRQHLAMTQRHPVPARAGVVAAGAAVGRVLAANQAPVKAKAEAKAAPKAAKAKRPAVRAAVARRAELAARR
jgi:hypothetical protein